MFQPQDSDASLDAYFESSLSHLVPSTQAPLTSSTSLTQEKTVPLRVAVATLLNALEELANTDGTGGGGGNASASGANGGDSSHHASHVPPSVRSSASSIVSANSAATLSSSASITALIPNTFNSNTNACMNPQPWLNYSSHQPLLSTATTAAEGYPPVTKSPSKPDQPTSFVSPYVTPSDAPSPHYQPLPSPSDSTATKRKFEMDNFPYSDPQSQRITASLSSRFSKSLKMDRNDITQQTSQPILDPDSAVDPSFMEPETNKSLDLDDGILSTSGMDFSNHASQPQHVSNIFARSPSRNQNSSLTSQRKIASSRHRVSKRPSSNSIGSPASLRSQETIWIPPCDLDSMDEDNNNSALRNGESTRFTFESKGYDSFALSKDSEQPGDLSPVLERLEKESIEKGLDFDKMQSDWNAKRRELEHNLSLMQSGLPSDSYDDLKALTEKIMEAGRILSGGCMDELRTTIRMWQSAEPLIEQAVHYICIVEDMKNTIQSQWTFPEDIRDKVKELRKLFDSKADMYGEVLDKGGQSWKDHGFPVDDELLIAIGTSGLMEVVLDALTLGADCANLTKRPFFPHVVDGAIVLATVYLTWVTTIFDQIANRGPPGSRTSRSPEARIALIVDNSIRIVDSLKMMRMGPSVDIPDMGSLFLKSPQLRPIALPSSGTNGFNPGRLVRASTNKG
ncbi:hypothetical protein HDV05_008672 [Chytridiales sp. JEL 0842]|nr:hypothetical protein HDV05_008672 [Chytridiales sp. JEL 0842]